MEKEKALGCSRDPKGEKTHGIVKRENEFVWECRCENYACNDYHIHMLNPITRFYEALRQPGNVIYTEVKYTWLGPIENIEKMIHEQYIEYEDEDESLYVDPFIDTERILETTKEISNNLTLKSNIIDTNDHIIKNFINVAPSEIIKANIDSKIFVNAGPGTGKTHTVIERLEYIINNFNHYSIDLSNIYVITFTNAARDVILQRLTEKGLGTEAKELVICTLDSLAWQNLTWDDKNNDKDLFSLGYDGCIGKFNNEFNADEWSGLEYLIIDELQDIVNNRARMVLRILDAINCGYLLLGDNCQAIYDWDSYESDSLSSVGFYRLLNVNLPSDTIRYELTGNKRQSEVLSKNSDELRNILLNHTPIDVNNNFIENINRMPLKSFKSDDFSGSDKQASIAILTRDNGQAEWISAELHEKGISHNLIRSVTQKYSLSRWLADMFWDFTEPRITKEEFIERFNIRVKSVGELSPAPASVGAISNRPNPVGAISVSPERDIITASTYFNAMIDTLTNDSKSEDFIKIEEFIKDIKNEKHMPPLLQNLSNNRLTISTIHKSKGKEFDHVYLLYYTRDMDHPEEKLVKIEDARVWYVGVTRPKLKLERIEKRTYNNRKTSTKRWINARKQQKFTNLYAISKIVVGFPDDVDPFGFVKGSFETATKRQEYISNKVKINDKLEVKLINDEYQIIHEEFIIGYLTKNAKESIVKSLRCFNKNASYPPKLYNLYVKDIVTIVPYSHSDEIDLKFRESRFWLGVELTGFA